MILVKNLVKKILRVDPYAGLTPLPGMIYIGSRYHGYHIPGSFFNTSSVCYCVGAGTDISFDTELVHRFGCRVFIFDPMPYALQHYNNLVAITKAGEKMTIDGNGNAYQYQVTNDDLLKVTFLDIGIWKEKSLVKFYEPAKENYAGHSITNLQQTGSYIEAMVDRLPNIMNTLNHKAIDLLKLEIEGAEYTVIDTIEQDRPDIKIICVEFDEVFHSKGFSYLFKIKDATRKLLNAGYKMTHTTHLFKRTFIRNDIFESLKKL